MSQQKLDRRNFFGLASGLAVFASLPKAAWAQTYPVRPVRIVVGFTAGGGTDIVARVIGQWLSEKLGQSFVIENRGGAAGNLAAETVARSPADGHTLLFCGSWDAINATLYSKLKFNFLEDIAPVAGVAVGPNVLVVHRALPVRTLADFIGYCRDNPGKVTFASAGIGTVPHLSGELLMSLTGTKLVHVAYRGMAPAINDLIGGHVQASFSTMPPVLELVQSGQLRALAVTSSGRTEMLPDLPAVSELVSNYEATLQYGFGAPKNTDEAIIDILNKEIVRALSDPGIKARFVSLGIAPMPMSPQAYGHRMLDETKKWAGVIQNAGIKMD